MLGEKPGPAPRCCFLILTEFNHLSSMPGRYAIRNRWNPDGGRWHGGQEEGDQKEEEVGSTRRSALSVRLHRQGRAFYGDFIDEWATGASECPRMFVDEGGDPPSYSPGYYPERVGLFGLGQGAWLGGGGLGLVVPLEPLHLFDELADVLELAIDRGESDIGDRVEALEMVHDDPSELLAADLLLGPLVELSLDLDDDVVDGLNSDRPLLARLQD